MKISTTNKDEGRNPAIPDGERSPRPAQKRHCECVQITGADGRYMFTDKSNCFVHSPSTAKHNERLDRMLREFETRSGVSSNRERGIERSLRPFVKRLAGNY